MLHSILIVKEIFKNFTYQHEFKRSDIEDILKIGRSRSSEIIRLMLEYDMAEHTSRLKYKLKKWNNDWHFYKTILQ